MSYIKDEEFIRGNVPMTKEEVRILSIAKMELEDDFNVMDVGAGTGSISIEMSRICKRGQVIGIEKNKEAIKILEKNKEKFKAHNFKIIQGEALEVIQSLNRDFDVVFIGGSGGNIEKIIKMCTSKIKCGGKIVMNFITINNVYKAIETLKELNLEFECIQVSISKTVKNTYMLKGNNPIFIVKGVKK